MESKTGFVASSFDILHPGYVMMLKECKDNCNYLVVGLHENPSWGRDNKNSPIMSLHERFLVLKSIRYVDEIAPYNNENELVNLLKFYSPDVRFLGSDYKTEEMKRKITGRLYCENIHFINRFHNYSSSSLRKEIYEAEKRKVDLEKFKREEVLV
jgi:glycerol-3-phosphate cytidylyltransferase